MRRSLVLTLTTLTFAGVMAFGQEAFGASVKQSAVTQPSVQSVGNLEVIDESSLLCSDLGPTYDECKVVEITNCPSLRPGSPAYVDATIAYDDAPAEGLIPGMVSLFSGEEGAGWWGTGSLPSGYGDFIGRLRADGYLTAQIKWSTELDEDCGDPNGNHCPNSWLESHTTVSSDIGPQRMACRPATVIAKFLWAQIYNPLLIDNRISGDGCGFCLTGNSGGASQIAYSLVGYNLLGTVIDGLFPTSGPVHTKLDLGCKDAPVPPEDPPTDWGFPLAGRGWIDASYIWNLGEDGYCSTGTTNSNWITRWGIEGADNLGSGANYSWPNTRVELIVGSANDIYGHDSQLPIRHHACAFYNKLTSSPRKYWVVSSMEHTIQQAPYGLKRLLQAIEDSNGSSSTPCTVP